MPQSSPPIVRLQLPGQFIPSAKSVRGLEKLTPEQQTALSEAFTSTIAETLTNADAETWERVKKAYPALSDLPDEELQAAVDSYVSTRPQLLEVLVETPVGAVFLINLVLWATGLGFCDLPFIDSSSRACVQVFARRAAGG